MTFALSLAALRKQDALFQLAVAIKLCAVGALRYCWAWHMLLWVDSCTRVHACFYVLSVVGVCVFV